MTNATETPTKPTLTPDQVNAALLKRLEELEAREAARVAAEEAKKPKPKVPASPSPALCRAVLYTLPDTFWKAIAGETRTARITKLLEGDRVELAVDMLATDSRTASMGAPMHWDPHHDAKELHPFSVVQHRTPVTISQEVSDYDTNGTPGSWRWPATTK